MGQGNVVTATANATASATAKSTMDAQLPTSLRDRVTAGGALRILLAERRASAHSELSRRLKSHGHEVVARVTSAQGAIDYAGLLTPDVVLFSPMLEDAAGLTVAMTVSRQQPGVAAVVFTSHPAAANPASRPNWGSVALLPADVDSDDLHAELWRAVDCARAAVAAGSVTGSPVGVSDADMAAEHDLVMSYDMSAMEPMAVAEAVAEPVAEAEPALETASPVAVEVLVECEPVIELVVDTASPVQTESFIQSEPLADLESFTADKSVVEHDPYVEIEVVDEVVEPFAPAARGAERTEAEVIAEMVDALYPATGDTVTLLEPDADYSAELEVERDDDIVERAVAVLVERVRLTETMAYRLMQQEAADTAQSMADVARAMLSDAVEGAMAA